MNTEITKRRLQVLDETLALYNINNRCIDRETKSCEYVRAGNSLGCAVGRLIPDKTLCKTLNDLGTVSNENVFDLLPENVKYLGQYFLKELQMLHDCEDYWDANGPTISGLNAALRIRQRFNLYIVT